MDFSALAANLRWSWAHGASPWDGIKSLYWTYSASLPKRRNGLIVNLQYPHPIGDLKLRVRTNRSDRFIFGEVFDHRYYQLQCVPPPTTILDVGTNVGFTAVFFARSFPDAQLACVEPEPGNLRVLEENLRLNGVKATVFPAAVSMRNGTEILAIHEKDYGHSLVQGSNPAGRTLEVAAMTIPAILDRLGWPRIELLKMDIEGYERHLLAQACPWLQLVDKLFIEWHDSPQEGRLALDRIAARHGFSAPRLLPGIWLLARA
ncbi:MAG: FkbM family methyltransferase [Rhizomicrobium sp.]